MAKRFDFAAVSDITNEEYDTLTTASQEGGGVLVRESGHRGAIGNEDRTHIENRKGKLAQSKRSFQKYEPPVVGIRSVASSLRP
jgi:hypothetical protein